MREKSFAEESQVAEENAESACNLSQVNKRGRRLVSLNFRPYVSVEKLSSRENGEKMVKQYMVAIYGYLAK